MKRLLPVVARSGINDRVDKPQRLNGEKFLIAYRETTDGDKIMVDAVAGVAVDVFPSL
ncbi:MAG: hypothetical protein AAGE99_04815 [Chlamydiota bacterium]